MTIVPVGIICRFQAFLRPIPPKPIKSVPLTDGTVALSEPLPVVCISLAYSETTAIILLMISGTNLCPSIRPYIDYDWSELIESVLCLEYLYGSARLHRPCKTSAKNHFSDQIDLLIRVSIWNYQRRTFKYLPWMIALFNLIRCIDSQRMSHPYHHQASSNLLGLSRSFNLCRTLRVLNLDYNE